MGREEEGQESSGTVKKPVPAPEAQDVLKTFLEYNTILFVGCGSGLEDPNFDVLLKWASERQKNIPNRHCLLVFPAASGRIISAC